MRRLKATPLFMFLLKDVDKLEHDAQSQYRFNRFWAIFWFGQMFLLPLLVWVAPKIWMGIEFFYITEASLWANFATHFGAMSGALAAMNTTERLSDQVDEVSDNVDDIHHVTETVYPELINEAA
jgi:hypothetical protein